MLGALIFGYDNTYYSGVLAMREFQNQYGTEWQDGQKALAPSFQSLTTSTIYIGDALGALIAAPINEKWGRKATFWSASFCVIAGGVCQAADTNHEGVIVLGRIFIGLGVGQFTVTSLLYASEVAPVEIRGPILMMYQFLQSCAQLVASGITQGTEGIQTSLSYKLPMGGLVVLPLLLIIILPFIPESPTWYVLRNQHENAEKSLRKIHKSHANYDPAQDMALLEEIKRVQEHHAEASSWKAIFFDPIERRKLIASAGAMFSQQICGILLYYNYITVVSQSIGISQPFLIQLLINVVQVIAVAACVLTSNKISKRSNLLISTGFIFVAFIITGGVGTQRVMSEASRYVFIVVSFIVVVGYNFGLGPVTYGVASEMSTGVNHNKIMSISVLVLYFSAWLISFTAPYLYYTANLGLMLGFIYAGTTIFSLAWIWFCVGETTGRTSAEIGLFFERGIPVRKWQSYVFEDESILDEKEEAQSSVTGHADHVERSSV